MKTSNLTVLIPYTPTMDIGIVILHDKEKLKIKCGITDFKLQQSTMGTVCHCVHILCSSSQCHLCASVDVSAFVTNDFLFSWYCDSGL